MRHETSRPVKPPALPSPRSNDSCPSPLTKGGSRGVLPAASKIRRSLLAWYDRNRRDLPWRRRANDPYAQWVAEIMLQQTRVETVLDYYERFLRCFPTVQALATADHESVLKAWEGLGYYRRVLHLHRAARQVCASGGAIPDTVDALRELPGVGEYTAAAIASIAFRVPIAAVDGNVARVLSRLFRLPAHPAAPEGKRMTAERARALLSKKRPGDFNQAWMDLGSLICIPRAPRCAACPLAGDCQGFQTGDAESFPVPKTRRSVKIRPMPITVGVLMQGGRMLVRRRPEGGLWSGLWEFPNVEPRRGEKSLLALGRLVDDVSATLVGAPRNAGTVRHELTHRSLRMRVYVGEVTPNGTTKPVHRWVTPAAFAKLAVSTAHRRVFEAAEALRRRSDAQGLDGDADHRRVAAKHRFTSTA